MSKRKKPLVYTYMVGMDNHDLILRHGGRAVHSTANKARREFLKKYAQFIGEGYTVYRWHGYHGQRVWGKGIIGMGYSRVKDDESR